MDAWEVFIAGLITALATGLGALPLLFVERMSVRVLGISKALAGGAMVGASVGLFYEGGLYSIPRTIAGAAVGIAFLVASRVLLRGRHELHLGTLHGAGARQAILIIAIMTIHSFTEGVGVGVAFGDGRSLGLVIAIAIAIHNIPEGLAISLTVVPQGGSVRSAFLWSVFSSLPQPLMALPAFIGVTVVESLLPAGLGFAGGAMTWLVVTDLIPEARDQVSDVSVATTVVLAAIAMLGIQVAVGL